ncbi:diguanylate cyclase [Alkaliphilus serpentinus]|uniref:Diguanylate cyclase n=1 Tax=Alkaliphilus serpentinus TaxID=1482731 RepID=A0A833M9N9_9FIRM|nr:diguanylate cyclase [Alkaliphilus serpentinus]KAB3529044.1 diguanylate cyclase [Alkaliphilus serpentinus]
MIGKILGILDKEDFINRIEDMVSGCSEVFTLASIDIDDFETVNSYYGESVGDDVIKKIASILKQNIKNHDLVCRSNKDEFNVLFTSTSAETGLIIVEEIRRYLDKNTFQLGGRKKEIAIKISGGIASYPRDAKTVVELLRAADSALFRAKREGKNRICLAENESMVQKTNYFTKTQLERLADLSKKTDKTEAFLLREALDDLFDKYSK